MVEAILAEAIQVTWERYAGGSYTADGRWVKDNKTSSTIRAAVQPAQGRALQDVEEGVRDKTQYFLWTEHKVANGDVIVYDGKPHRIVQTWPRPQDGFTKAAMGLMENA